MYELNSNAGDKATGGTPTGDFVNRNLLRIDPKSGIAFRSRFAAPPPHHAQNQNPRVLGTPAPAATASGAAQVNANAASFAQKLAALGSDTPSPVPEPTPMATSSPLAKQLAAMGSNLGSTVPDPVDIATRKVQQFSNPTRHRDDQGRTLPQYRMGIGHRILGTLANFANGFAGNRAQPIYVGPGALNNRYYQDEQQRRENLDAAQQELQAIQGPAKLHNVIDYRTIGKDPTGKGWVGKTYSGEKRNIAPPPYAASGEQDDEENNDETQ